VEATYAGLPLILVTADRPRNYRGRGAPQSIEQMGIFSHYVETCIDLEHIEDPMDLEAWSQTRPLQINVCFDEPLIDDEISEIDFHGHAKIKAPSQKFSSTAVQKITDPVVVVGRLTEEQVEVVVPYLVRWNAPVYAEGISQLRGDPRLKHLLLSGGEKSVEKAFMDYRAASVIRLGGVPTLRFWRDLEKSLAHIPVYSISELDFGGLSRSHRHRNGFQNLANLDVKLEALKTKDLQLYDSALREANLQLFKKYPTAEASLVYEFSQMVQGHSVYLGNSLPIREWDLVASAQGSWGRIWGHRGANGIDGQISGFLGWSESDPTGQTENWALIGDLTALYDLQALWITGQLEKSRKRIVIMNNSGGMIFKNIFGSDAFLNSHQLEFSKWAEMFGWSYLKVQSIDQIKNLGDHVVIEIVPDNQASEEFWKEYRLQ
jgi:2-succinyl-5-enolpyruvyl-6-hydroxy-3-cyclohexene-1-carboxylate synthase